MCEIHFTRHDTCLEYSVCENCLCLLLLCSILLSNGGVSNLLHVNGAFVLCHKQKRDFHTATMGTSCDEPSQLHTLHQSLLLVKIGKL